MRQLSRHTLKNPYENGWPKADSQYHPVSISLPDRLLKKIDERVEDSRCEHGSRSALVRDALYDWLEKNPE